MDRVIRIISLVFLFFLLISFLPLKTDNNSGLMSVSNGGNDVKMITVAHSLFSPEPVLASADYVCDGVDDSVEIQAAVDALPATGGKITIYAGEYHLTATISRSIDNVCIEGVGKGTYLTYDGANIVINAGVRNGWIFRDIRVDAGGIDVSMATEWSLSNVWLDTLYVAKRVDFTPANSRDLTTKTYVDGKIPATLPSSFVNSSGGAGDSGKGVLLNGAGKVDSSMISSTFSDNTTGSGTNNYIVKWTGTSTQGNATNTDTQVSDTVGKAHTQGTDTSLGTMSAGINMGGNSITNVNLVDGVDVSALGAASGNVTTSGFTSTYIPVANSSTGLANSIMTATGALVSIPKVTGNELAPAISGANWTGGAGWTVGAGTITRVASAVTTTYPTVAIVPDVNKYYVVLFTISGYSAGSVTMTLGGVESTALQGDQDVYLYVSPYTTGNLIFTPSATFAGVISVVSVKEYTGGELQVDGGVLYYDSRGHPNRLSHVTRHLSEMQTDTLLDKSRSTLTCSGGVLTYTLFAVYGEGTWNFNGVIYPLHMASASVALTGGTDAIPKTNWVYFELVGNTPTLTVSTTGEPTTTHIMVAEFIVGAVSGSSYTIYGYNRARTEVDSFVKRVIGRFENSGSLYVEGALPTCNTTTLAVASGGKWYQGIFEMTAANTVTSTDFYFIKNSQYVHGTSLADLLFYTDGTAIGNHNFANIVWGIVPTTTTASGALPTTVKLFAVLQTNPVTEYTLAQARQDLYDATNYYPPDAQLKEVFVPIARTIVSEDAPTQLQTFDTGLYFKDLRGRITSGGGAATGTDTSGLLDLAGTRSMTGSLNMGTSGNITLAAGMTVDGVDISALGGGVSGSGTSGTMVKWNGAGTSLTDATNTDAQVADAVGKAHSQDTDTALGAVSTKNPPLDADKVIYRDSNAGDALTTSTWTQVKAFLKTYFDGLYGTVTGAGSLNKISKWASATALESSSITDNATGVYLTSDLNMGAQDITNVGLVDGVDVSALSSPTYTITEGAELAPAMTQALWTEGAGWTINDGAGTATRVASAVTTLVPTTPIVPDTSKKYKVEFVISSWTAGSIVVSLGTISPPAFAGNQTTTVYIHPSTTDNLVFTPTADFAGVISSVSVTTFSGGILTVEGDIYSRDANGKTVRLGNLFRSLTDMSSNVLLDKSRSTLTCAGGVLTYTLYAVYGEGSWNFNGVIYPITVPSAGITLTGGTDAIPKTNYIYFYLVGNTPTFAVSVDAEPTGDHIDVATFVVGAVSGSSYTIYGYDRNRIEVDSFIAKSINRFILEGTLYVSGSLPTANSTSLSIASGGKWLQGISEFTSGNTVAASTGFYVIEGDGSFSYHTSLADLHHYGDAGKTALGATERQNIVWGIVPTTTTASLTLPSTVKLFAVLQDKPSVVYTDNATAISDVYDATNYAIPHTELEKMFVPIARTIVLPNSSEFVMFDDGTYFKDVRGKITEAGSVTSVDTSQFLYSNGARPLTGNLAVDPGVTIDGVDISTIGASHSQNTDYVLKVSNGGADLISSGNLADNLTVTAGKTIDGIDLSDRIPSDVKTFTINFVVDGGGSAITAGIKGDLEIPSACTITKATALADQNGTLVVSIWKDTYANFPPLVGDNITAGAPITIVAGNAKIQDAVLTGWNKTINSGDILRYNVDSCTSITRVTISLTATRN
jgi:hypothetical protein